MAQWILTGVALAAIIYNTIVTHVVLKNDVKHLAAGQKELKDKLDKLIFHLLPKSGDGR